MLQLNHSNHDDREVGLSVARFNRWRHLSAIGICGTYAADVCGVCLMEHVHAEDVCADIVWQTFVVDACGQDGK